MLIQVFFSLLRIKSTLMEKHIALNLYVIAYATSTSVLGFYKNKLAL